MSKIPYGRAFLRLALLLPLLSCGDSGPNEPAMGPPASAVALSGTGQSGEAGSALALPLVVQVKDANGRGVAGVTVVWSADGGHVAAAEARTDASGRATAAWTLSPALGEQTARATVASLAPVSFTATAVVPVDARVAKLAGDAQVDTVARPVRDSLVIEVRTSSGQPLAGVPVTWAVPGDAANVGGSIAGSATSGSDGRAHAVWTLGTAAGAQQVNVQVAALPPVSFTGTAVPDVAARVRLSADTLIVGTWGDSASLGATVADRYDNARPDDVVAWSSTDTLIARITADGIVSTRRAGTAQLVASAGVATAAVTASVQLQMNPQCVVPTGTPARPAVGAAPTFVSVPDVFQTDLIGREVTIREPVAMDYDGDGDQDLVVLFFQEPRVDPYVGGLVVWRNDNGRFVTASKTAVFGTENIAADAPRQFELADFNGDGIIDLFAAQHGFDADPFPGAPNLLLLSQGNGQMREVAATNLSPSETAYTHGSASGDFDCDGDVDLLVSNSAYDHFNHVYINDGTGRFVADDSRIPAVLGQYPNTTFSAVACDFDRDGDLDIYWGGMIRRPPYFLINDGFGRFRFAPAEIRVPDSGYGRDEDVAESRCADIDLDGWPDLIIGSDGFNRGGDGSYGVFLNGRDWNFEDATARLIPTGWELPNDWYWRMRPIDMNGDGWLDLLPDTNEGNDVMLLNQGPDQPFRIVRLPAPYSRFVDYNGDGRPDIITTGWWSAGNEGRPQLWENR